MEVDAAKPTVLVPGQASPQGTPADLSSPASTLSPGSAHTALSPIEFTRTTGVELDDQDASFVENIEYDDFNYWKNELVMDVPDL